MRGGGGRLDRLRDLVGERMTDPVSCCSPRPDWSHLEPEQAECESDITTDGADKLCYGDSYSRDLSNDIEPTSLTSSDCYVRPNSTCSGWGMYYANLFSALTRGALDANETLIFITAPKWGANVSGAVNVSWALSGRTVPTRLHVLLDSTRVATVDQPGAFDGWVLVDLANASVSHHTLAVQAEGVSTRFPLSLEELDQVAAPPAPSMASVQVVRR